MKSEADVKMREKAEAEAQVGCPLCGFQTWGQNGRLSELTSITDSPSASKTEPLLSKRQMPTKASEALASTPQAQSLA